MVMNASSYFSANPDVAKEYESNTYGLSPDAFAEAHWLMYGQDEQRSAPTTIDPYFSGNSDVASSYGKNRYDMSPDDFAQAHYLIYGTDEKRNSPDALNKYFVDNPDVASAYKQNRYELSPTDFAFTHYYLYGQNEDRKPPQGYPVGFVPPVKNPVNPLDPKVPKLIDEKFAKFTDGDPQIFQNLGTFGASDGELLGAGNAEYQSNLIKSLRSADSGPESNNPGVTLYGYSAAQPGKAK